MTDIFFSYRSVDRDRVRPVHDAFAKQGFDVFWDQEVPSGVDWDTWIRQHLSKSKCAVVFWSVASVESDNVRHEATVAKRQGKLITVLLEHLTPDQFPMGLYSQQAINLAEWKGDFDDAEWQKLNRDIEAKLTPPWMQRKIYELEAELVAERARREGVENRDRALQGQITKEVLAQDNVRRERNEAIEEVLRLKLTIQELRRAREDEAQAAKPSQALTAAELPREALVDESFRPAKYAEIAQAGQSVSIENRFTDTIWPKIAVLALYTRGRIALVSTMLAIGGVLVYFILPQAPFTIMSGTEAVGDGKSVASSLGPMSMKGCEQSCQRSSSCTVFTYDKPAQSCYLYSSASFKPNTAFDSGLRK